MAWVKVNFGSDDRFAQCKYIYRSHTFIYHTFILSSPVLPTYQLVELAARNSSVVKLT